MRFGFKRRWIDTEELESAEAPCPAAQCPLSMALPGQVLRLVKVQGCPRRARRLAELGLCPGVEMSVIQDAGGPLLVAVRDSRIALGRGVAHNVIVESAQHRDGLA